MSNGEVSNSTSMLMAELGKGDLGMVELQYKPQPEHAGIHGKPQFANTKHHHTDRFNGDTYHPIYLPSPAKGREMWEEKPTTIAKYNIEDKLHVFAQLARGAKPVCDPMEHGL